MITLLDQIGNELHFKLKPSKVISLVPSMTELWVEMNDISSLIGRTKFCVHPKPSIKEVQKIGGTKNPRLDQIIAMKPDLILANKEENHKEHIDKLSGQIPVYVSDVKTIQDNIDMVKAFQTLSTNPKISFLDINQAFSDLVTQGFHASTMYLIWKDPYMLAGGDTFINAMIESLGLKNVFRAKNRYPEISINEIISINPDYILLSSEPYPFKESDVESLRNLGVTSEILLVDGEAFSWYGSRILHTLNYLNRLALQLKKT